jgi:peroxiredoxin
VERRYEGEVRFLGVAWQDTWDAMQAFVDRHGIRMPTAVDEDGSLFASFGFTYQPAWVFVNDGGQVTTFFGALGEDGLEEEIRGLIDA